MLWYMRRISLYPSLKSPYYSIYKSIEVENWFNDEIYIYTVRQKYRRGPMWERIALSKICEDESDDEPAFFAQEGIMPPKNPFPTH